MEKLDNVGTIKSNKGTGMAIFGAVLAYKIRKIFKDKKNEAKSCNIHPVS